MNDIDRELKKAMKAIIGLWENSLHDEYFLIYRSDRTLEPTDIFLFGNMRNARITPTPKGDSYSEIPLSLFLSEIDAGIAVRKIGFISKDLIYTFNIRKEEELLIILGIDNMTYGRGSMNGYIIATYREGLWQLSSSKHYRKRTSRYDGISGSIDYCVDYIFKNENDLGHPYQDMIDSYPWKYRETQSSVLEINTNSGSLGFNRQTWLSF
jgi:hypothetical protein